MKNKGRPRKRIPEKVINEIIYRFSKEKKVTGKIKYMEIFRFSTELFKQKEIQFEISEFYWRKGDGKKLVDKANEVFTHSLSSLENTDDKIIDTEDSINKFFKGNKQDKNKLIGLLKINENKLKYYIKLSEKNEKRSVEKSEQIEILKEKIKCLNLQVLHYEDKLFEWLELSNSKSIPLTNLLTTGKSRSIEAEELLKSIFSEDPLEIFNNASLKNKVVSRTEALNSSSLNTISINTFKEKQKSVLNDIDF